MLIWQDNEGAMKSHGDSCKICSGKCDQLDFSQAQFDAPPEAVDGKVVAAVFPSPVEIGSWAENQNSYTAC